MNISISYNWLKEFLPTTLSPDEFASEMSAHGPAVERVHREHEDLDGIVVGRVVSVHTHPNADKLRRASVDVGKEVVEVVCGGSNLTAGMKVAFARIGARVRWHGEGDLVKLKSAEIRGVKSFGMICAANEIGLSDLYPHAEREIMDVSSISAAPGTAITIALGLDDAIFDFEVTTNRIDAFSVVGLAREARAILGVADVSPRSKPRERRLTPATPGSPGPGISVVVQAKQLCPRYQAAVIRGVRMGPSPAWMKQRLIASGLRPINAAVDVANYVMLELGHPLHTFDAAKLTRGMIMVREARSGESIAALDGKTYSLTRGMLVIADADRPVAIAGVMGSEGSGVTSATTDIIIEAAAFDPVSIRRTSHTLGIVSDAALRFEKGIHPESTALALERAVELLTKTCGGAVDPTVVDVRAVPWKPRSVKFRPERASDLAGVVIPSKTQRANLEALGFKVKTSGKTWNVTIPWWRDADIEGGERDLIEEVTRLYGYARIPDVLPPGVSARARVRELDDTERIREFFCGAGFLETQTMPLVPEAWAPDGLELDNPLTSDGSRLRTSLVPSLLSVVADNQERASELRLFEISRVQIPRPGNLPDEPTFLLAVLAGSSPSGEQFYRAEGVCAALGRRLDIPFEFVAPSAEDVAHEGLHPGRSLAVRALGHAVGFVGELALSALRRYGVEMRVAMVLLDVAHALAARTFPAVSDVPAFPAVKRDISFIVPVRTKHAELYAALRAQSSLLVSCELFDVFSGTDIPSGKKSMAYHLAFQSDERTLTADEVAAVESKLKNALESKFGAVIRS